MRGSIDSHQIQLRHNDDAQCLIERRRHAQTHLVGTPVEAADWLRRQRDVLQQVDAARHAHVDAVCVLRHTLRRIRAVCDKDKSNAQ